MPKDKRDLIAVLFLFGLVLLFFAHLFVPKPKVFYTPDFGRSDLWHYNYPMRVLLHESLRNFELPLWNKDIGAGFPYFATGTTNFFLLDHFLLYLLLPVWLAFNLAYVTTFIIAIIGMFLLGRILGFSRLVAILSALPFTFFGFLVTRSSQNTVFGAAYLPLFTYSVVKVIREPKLQSILLLSFVVSQLMMAGHVQIPFIGFFGMGILILALKIAQLALRRFNTQQHDPYPQLSLTKQNLSLLGLGCILGIALSAIQLFPFLELWRISTRKDVYSFDAATQMSLSAKELVTLFFPFALGTPANGSYPLNTENVYWEKIAYAGLLPTILVVFAISKLRKRPTSLAFLILLVISILLVMGRHSPISFLYTLPPLSFFRAPARFLLLTSLSLSILFGFVIDYWEKRINRSQTGAKVWRWVFGFLLVIVSGDLFIHAWRYHPTVAVKDALKVPESAEFVQKYPGRIFDLGSEAPYLSHFLQKGWQDTSFYLYMKNALAANQHIVYGLANVDAAYPLAPERYKLIDNTLKYQAFGDLERLVASSSTLHKRMLSLTSTRFLVSPFYFKDPDLRRVYTVNPPNNEAMKQSSWPKFYIYENVDVLPRFRFASDYEVVSSIDEALKRLGNPDFAYKEKVLLEEELKELSFRGNPERSEGNSRNLTQSNADEEDPSTRPVPSEVKGVGMTKEGKQEIELVRDDHQQLSLRVSTDVENLLVIADSFYPGWKAYIDGKETKIYPANINQRAVIVPAGNHTIKMKFQPLSVYLGTGISGVSGILWVILFLFAQVHPRGGIALHLRKFRPV